MFFHFKNKAAALKQNLTIRELYLSSNQLKSTDAQHLKSLLKNNSTLQTLDLTDNALGSEGLHAIAEGLADQPAGPGDGLQRLWLAGNGLDANGVNAFNQAFPFCRDLRSIDLSRNPLGDAGVESLMEGLQVLATLRSLRLADCLITHSGLFT